MQLASRKKSTSIYSKIIKLWPFGGAAGKYSHSELVFSNGTTFSSDEADGGTRWKDQIETPADWDFIEVPCTTEEEARIKAFCNGEIGCKYDKRGIIFSFLPVPIGLQSKDKWFCSEICVSALQLVGLLVGVTPASVAPSALAKMLTADLPKWKRVRQVAAMVCTLALLLTGCTPTTINIYGCRNKVEFAQPKTVGVTPSLEASGNTVPLSGVLP